MLLLVLAILVGIITAPVPSEETPVVEVEKQVVLKEPVKPITPEPVIESDPWTDEEVIILARMLWGEARGVISLTEKAACVWCVLNRVDAWGSSITEITTAPLQFVGYSPSNPIDDELKALCEDVLSRWYAEKNGEPSAGRVLPVDYLWFSGDGERNHFRNAYRNGEIWDWSLSSPYES